MFALAEAELGADIVVNSGPRRRRRRRPLRHRRRSGENSSGRRTGRGDAGSATDRRGSTPLRRHPGHRRRGLPNHDRHRHTRPDRPSAICSWEARPWESQLTHTNLSLPDKPVRYSPALISGRAEAGCSPLVVVEERARDDRLRAQVGVDPNDDLFAMGPDSPSQIGASFRRVWLPTRSRAAPISVPNAEPQLAMAQFGLLVNRQVSRIGRPVLIPGGGRHAAPPAHLQLVAFAPSLIAVISIASSQRHRRRSGLTPCR